MDVHAEEEENRAEPPEPSCLSMKSDGSMCRPPDLSGPGPSDPKGQNHRWRAEPPGPSCLSMKSDRSMIMPPDLSGPSDPKRRSSVGEEDQLSSCPQSGDRSRTTTGQQTANQSSSGPDVGLQEVLEEHRLSLRSRCERVTEGSEEPGSRTLLNRIYTELYITEGWSEEVNTQHEVRQLETTSRTKRLHDAPIRCQDIFKASPDEDEDTDKDQHEDKVKAIRLVLTNGVAGAGKTFSVLKFTLDWAEGSENQDVHVVLLLSFRELVEQRFSIPELCIKRN